MSVHYFGRTWKVETFESQCHVCEVVERFESRDKHGLRMDLPLGWRNILRHVKDGEWGHDEIYVICPEHPDWQPTD